MNVLITGATGFVGTWLTRKLLDLGHDVRVLSRSGQAKFPFDSKSIEVIKGDISDITSLKNATQNIQTVFHLAGLIGYTKALHQEMVKVNVIGTANVIEAMTANNCPKLVYMSSVVAIGAGFHSKQILNEESEYNVKHLNLGYFETKKAAEDLVKAAVQKKQIESVILNPSTIYGPGDATKGSRKMQIKVAQGKFPFYTSGGVNVIHIEDVINALIAAWEKGRNGERYILAGENIYIKQLFQYIAEVAGVPAPKILIPKPILHLLGKIGDTLEAAGKKGPISSENAWTSTLFHWFDNSKAKKELGLNPRPAQLAIRDSVEWMRENGLLKK